ncbi:lipase member I-like [Culicoides brevitarsis]|uniref:lipase member I-like n=1 Tax=Culicoides brevitarsis TaxID=469753 RepID=UPI00307BC704
MFCYDKKGEKKPFYRHVPKLIDSGVPVVILIHGWRRLMDLKWMDDVALDYRKYNNSSNVCLIYWEELAWEIDLMKLKEESLPKVVRRTAHFIKLLHEDHGISYDDISLVGHGIGAHIAGAASNKVDNKVGKIYALDPFGPLYSTYIQENPAGRLDPKDAKYVQALYTSSNVLGTELIVGHQNFKPNLGRTPQTPCLNSYMELKFVCSHQLAVDYFRYSLNPEYEFTAMKCNRNITNYIVQNCGKQHVYDRFGVHAEGISGVFYFEPFPAAPYVKTKDF